MLERAKTDLSVSWTQLKRALISSAKFCGAMGAAYHSNWRSRRLLIIAWHGISVDDEHEWAPGLYMSASQFARRLHILRSTGCNVLPLAEGLARLRNDTLPPRSVCLTFDDGFADFSQRAHPILKSFGFPATLYLTTRYLDSPHPVLPVALAYLAWTKRGRDFGIWNAPGLVTSLDLRSEKSRARAVSAVVDYARLRNLSLDESDQLLSSFALRIGADYERLVARRMLCLMSREEVRRVSHSGVDIQMHSHSHLSPQDRVSFLADLRLNRNIIEGITGKNPDQFCYPSGVHIPEYRAWLREEGVESAVTSDLGLASQSDDSFFLPRYTDGCGRSDGEFESWLSGLANLIPGRDREVIASPSSGTGSLVTQPSS